MQKTAIKIANKSRTSSKLHKYLEEMPRINISLKDVQKSLSGIRISLSRRVIEEREKR